MPARKIAPLAPEGFIVERGANARNEVLRDAAAVRTIYRVGDRVLLETTQHEGLFELDRIDRGRRSTFKPKTDLAKLFPLKEGRRLNAEFEGSYHRRARDQTRHLAAYP